MGLVGTVRKRKKPIDTGLTLTKGADLRGAFFTDAALATREKWPFYRAFSHFSASGKGAGRGAIFRRAGMRSRDAAEPVGPPFAVRGPTHPVAARTVFHKPSIV
jgi:hypothetical protein